MHNFCGGKEGGTRQKFEVPAPSFLEVVKLSFEIFKFSYIFYITTPIIFKNSLYFFKISYTFYISALEEKILDQPLKK